MECPGSAVDVIPACNAFPCPHNGGVSEWTQWTISEEPCGTSNSTRRRFCNNPVPKYRGEFCKEALIEYKVVDNPPCPTLDVDYRLRFDKEKWHYTMFYNDRELATALKKKIGENVIAAAQEQGETNVKKITFDKFERGSVIAYFRVMYEAVNRDQILTFNSRIVTKRALKSMSVSDIGITVPSVPCPPPTNLTYDVIDEYTVRITWAAQKCVNQTTRSYFYYALASGLGNATITWEIAGYEMANTTTNSTNSTAAGNNNGGSVSHPDSIVLLGLKVAVEYGGFFFNSIVGVGNGPPSSLLKFKTIMTPPTLIPQGVTAQSNAPTKILVEWLKIPKRFWGGELLGYKIKYLKYNVEKNYTVRIIDPGFTTKTLDGLKPHTLYYVEIVGFNSAGDGPPEFAVLMTQQGVPSILVPDVVVHTKQHINWFSVAWSRIPQEFVNGILLGYRINYYMLQRAGKVLGGEKGIKTIEVNNLTFYQRVDGLVNYARYEVTIAGFTIAGDGPSEKLTADTCNCHRDLYFNWFNNPPYVTDARNKSERSTNQGELTGLFPPMVKEMILEACKECRLYRHPTLRFFQSITGENPKKTSSYELKRDISSSIDVSYPIYGQVDRSTYVDSTKFLLFVKSSGCSLIVRKEKDPAGDLTKMIAGIIQVWPMMLVSYAIACVAGLLVWFVEKYDNPDEFAPHNPIIGIGLGFWWAFVTMTTMGYGDQTPRTILGRILAILWFLIGLILNGILIGAITSSIGILKAPTTYSLPGSNVAAIYRSYEYKYAFRKQAKIDPNVRYQNTSQMLDALAAKTVDVVFLDTFSMQNLQPILDKRSMKVAEMIDTNSGYGIVLGGLSTTLFADMQSLLLLREAQITSFIASMKPTLPKMEKDGDGEEDADDDIFSHKSYGFKWSNITMGAIIGFCVICGIAFNCWRKVRVRATKNDAKQFKPLEELVEEFKTTFEENLDELEQKHTNERFRLSVLKQSYDKKVSKIGKETAERLLLISQAQVHRKKFGNLKEPTNDEYQDLVEKIKDPEALRDKEWVEKFRAASAMKY